MKLRAAIGTDSVTGFPTNIDQGKALLSPRNRIVDNITFKRRDIFLKGALAGDTFSETLEGVDMNGGSPVEQVIRKSLSRKFLTLPTVLTLARVAAVPTLVAVFYSKEWWATTLEVTIFVMACITDWLDGYLARKMKSSSAFGAFLDPVADKLMVATTLVLLCTKPPSMTWFSTIPWIVSLPTIAIIGREITMSAVREWAAAQGGELHKVVAVNNLGKAKTASQMVALTLLLASRDIGAKTGLWTAVLGTVLLYVAAVLALWSLGVYVKAIWGSMFR